METEREHPSGNGGRGAGDRPEYIPAGPDSSSGPDANPANDRSGTIKQNAQYIIEDARFNALRNALMHTARRRHYDVVHRQLMFAVVATGTAGVGNFFSAWAGSEVFAAFTALLATLDLVLDLRGKARSHDDLRRRYYGILAEIDRLPDADEQTARRWLSEMTLITADEPDECRIVDCMAYNDALKALGRDPDHAFEIPIYRRLLAHYFTFSGYTPLQTKDARKTREERAGKRLAAKWYRSS